jgi:hypothetical protein
LSEGFEDGWRGFSILAKVDVGYDADDRHERIRGTLIRIVKSLPDRALVRPHLVRDARRHDSDQRRVLAVGVREYSPLDDRTNRVGYGSW